jgi:hypothetical protein
MTVAEAQREVRGVFLGGFVGTLVSSFFWLVSAALGTWTSPRNGIIALVVGGPLIFPVTQMLLRVAGRRASLSRENPMGQLATQIAFTIPLCFPLVAAVALHRLNWFYPAMMVVVGMHYLPFVFLYGMPLFGALCGLLVGGGIVIGLYLPQSFSLGAWVTVAALALFAFVLRAAVERERPSPAAT